MAAVELEILIGKLSAIEIELHNAARYGRPEESIEIRELAVQITNIINELKNRRIEECRSNIVTTFSKAFSVAIKRVLASEGLYVNNKNDPGGETKYGICKKQYPNEDIKNLTEARAMEIYHKDYWAPYFYDSAGAHLAEKVFDTAVNIGPKNAFKLLQESVNKLGGTLTVDGSIGAKSLEAINKFDENKIIEEYRKLQADYYRNLVVKNKKLEVFLKGWLARAAK